MDRKKLVQAFLAIAILTIALHFFVPQIFSNSYLIKFGEAAIAIALVLWLFTYSFKGRTADPSFLSVKERKIFPWIGIGLVAGGVLWGGAGILLLIEFGAAREDMFVIMPSLFLLVAGFSILVYWTVARFLQ